MSRYGKHRVVLATAPTCGHDTIDRVRTRVCQKQLRPLVPALMAALLLSSCVADGPAIVTYPEGEDISFKLASYNLLLGGALSGDRLFQTREVIESSEADIMVLGEHALSAAKIAEGLGWHVKMFGFDIAIISRYRIVDTLENGVIIEFNPGNRIAVCVVHHLHVPYGPYTLSQTPSLTAEELIATAMATRGAETEAYLADLAPHQSAGTPVFLAGDFNEPSHLDWTQEAVDAGIKPMVVDWPASRAVADAGLKDAYREVHPDGVTEPGLTWTPYPGEDDVPDRIDYIYFDNAELVDVALLGPDHPASDLVVEPYPSDHWALIAEFALRVTR